MSEERCSGCGQMAKELVKKRCENCLVKEKRCTACGEPAPEAYSGDSPTRMCDPCRWRETV